MNKFIIIPILVALVAAQTYSTTSCTCSQLLSQSDCTYLSSQGCAWNSTTSVCATSTETVTPTTTTYAAYCDSYTSSTCPSTYPCAYINSACTFFTGCTPYAKTTDSDCQAISTRCITDGTHCVEVTTCSAFTKQLPCVKNSSGAYCYWDTTNSVCVDANSCDKLPATLTTDALCRAQISTCTTTGTGCKTSGTSCSDQTTQISCVWNLAKSQACYWNGTACVDAICANAPTTLTTDTACIGFTTSGTCTTQANGGCVTRTTCSAATIQAACVTNSSGGTCYWNGTACVDKTCSNAPSTFTTNTACSGFLTTCITTGSGCVTNTTCSSATVQAACVQNASGTTCLWDTTCKEKTCSNAPSANNTHALCTAYLATCTVNSSSNGCTTRTCANAPTTILTNADCESYLPKSNCITKNGGGCVTNTTCAAINSQAACVADVSGTVCFYNTVTSACVDKTCVNAPTTYTDDATCSSYLKTCTVNSAGAGCVNRTCENLLTSALCSTDLNSKPCIYKALCYQKQCALAPTSYASHSECNTYLSSCTVNSSAAGCIPIPLVCSAITTSAACVYKRIVNSTTGAVIYGDCGWNGTVCIDKGCTTIDKTNVTTSACDSVISGCVSANPVSGTVSGCIDLPTTCAARLTENNCAITRSGYPTCLWNSSTSACVEKTCLTALTAGLTGVLASATASNCAGYLTSVTCLVSNDGASCIAPVTSCSTLTSSANCIVGAKTSGDCYWNSSTTKCLDKTCANINLTSHSNCHSELSTCTVNAAGTACMTLAACTAYTIAAQCHINASNQQCTWDTTTSKCINIACTSAANTGSYDSDGECKNYLTAAGTCTVIYKVGTAGCVARSTYCTDYVDENQCVKTAAGNACVWNNSQCLLKSTVVCANIVLGTYSDTNCEAVAYYCQANSGTTACETKACSDYEKTDGTSTGSTAITTTAHCISLNSTCVLNNQSTKTCQTKLATCDLYTTQLTCTDATAGACAWQTSGTPVCILASAATCASYTGADDAACLAYGLCKKGSATDCVATDCATASASPKTDASLTFAACQTINSSCVNDSANNNCIAAQSTCEGYSTTQTSCTFNSAGKTCFWSTSTCVTITSSTCTLVTGSGLAKADCQKYSTSCTAARDGNKCVPIVSACSSITTINNCVESTAGTCIQSAAVDASASCKDVTPSTACTALLLKATTTYTQSICTGLLSTCTFVAGGSTCVAKTCSNTSSQSGFSASFANCNGWLSSCTYDGTNCVAISATCAAQSSTACYRATEGECVTFNGACVKKTCDTAAVSNVSDANCSTYLSTCTVARVGGCQARLASCSSYTSAIQCKNNSSGGACVWNSLTLTCSDLTCANLEQGTAYDTHGECYGAITTSNAARCTVKVSNGAQVNGCQTVGACSSYVIQAQCIVNASAAECAWNTNLTTPACQDKACATADTASYTTHSGCQGYLTTCTVAVTVTNSVATGAGCQALAACSTYLSADQCQIDASGNACGWNGSVCANKSCATAPATSDYDTDAKCRLYLSGCTVASTGQGCTAVTACESYTTTDQCVSNTTGTLCYWVSATGNCITRTCDNAPSDTADAAACNTYLPGCTMDSVKCKSKICEDFALATDALCTAALSTCTSNGSTCVNRGTCSQAVTSAGCVTQSDGKLCQWVAATATAAAFCTVRTCSTAPTDLTTESSCAAYFTGCTTKSGGGCAVKSTCAAANVAAACTKDVSGNVCQWDSTANACRNKACSDYSGSTHAACQLISTSCTAGANGNCATMTTCALTTSHAGCVVGTDGPCLWVSSYTNSDGSTGACFKYSSCSSLAWTTNSQCNRISTNCTTNGSNCVGITLCSETNVNGGCVKGYDGACIQSVESLGSTNSPKCYAYSACSQAYYATHAACQTASSSCTTNGTTGCIALAACSTYAQAGCVINSTGSVTSSGLITSTGYCTWDTTNSACRDQICSDLTGTTHSTCYSQLSTCTSNGTACITKASCSTYESQTACQTAVGTDGTCFWDSTLSTPACRLMVCSDVTSGTSTAVCSAGLSGCISNGTACISKSTCSTYTTKTSCNSGGTDGICVFTASTSTTATAGTGTCALMSACSSASSDQVACTAAKDRCAWTAASTSGTTTTASSCASHTCATYYATNSACTNYLNWAKSLQQVCTLVSGTCTATDPTTLASSTCYTASSYTYTWSTSSSKCAVCTTASANTTNTTNSTNTTNDTTTTSGYILGFAVVVLSYIII